MAKKLVKRSPKKTIKRLSPKEKAKIRVQVAQDVINALDSKRFIAWQGTYLAPPLQDKTYNKLMLTAATKDVANAKATKYTTPKKGCEVCAIGSVFVTAVDRFNKVSLHDVVEYDDGFDGAEVTDTKMLKYLGAWFSVKQLRLMEAAFEGSLCGSEIEEDSSVNEAVSWHGEMFDRWDRTIKFYKNLNLTDAEYLLRQIMLNVIRHNGTFEPMDIL